MRSESPIALEPGSLVDPEFRSHQTDRLIRLERDADQALVYVLYEHKSAPDRWVSLQLLRYLAAIWHRSRPPRVAGRLPQIVPVVIYHGSRRWTSSLEFSRLVDGVTGDHVPRFAPRLVNLAEIPPERISGSLGFVVAVPALKFVRQRSRT